MTTAQPTPPQPVASFTRHGYRADVYSTTIPGEFKVVYRDPKGAGIERALLAGISTYHQREPELLARLEELAGGATPNPTPELGDWGEY